jgi:hypothetical protein
MRAYDNIFAAPLSRPVLAAIAALVDRQLPAADTAPHHVEVVANV